MTAPKPSPRRQPAGTGFARARGQASVFVIIVAAILVIAALLVYNSGRAVVTRIHLQNAADSAAYSGAVELARAYNFAAYSNRAMVANQVAIAQMVGLTSWIRYYCLVYSEDDECGDFTGVGTFDETIAALEIGDEDGGEPGETVMETYSGITQGLFDGINSATGPIVSGLNGLETVLGAKPLIGASGDYYLAATVDLGLSAINSGGLVKTVLQQTDPNAQIATATLGVGGAAAQAATLTSEGLIKAFIKTPYYNPMNQPNGDPNNRFHNVVMASRDGFDKSRTSAEILPFTALVWSFGTCLGDGIGGIDISSLGYSGSTSLSTDNKTWSTAPSGDKSNGFLGAGVCVINIPTPIGDIPIPIPLIIPIPSPTEYANVTDGGTGTDANPTYKLSGSSYSGLQPYLDVSNLKKPDYTAPTFTIFAARKQSTIATTQQLDAGTTGTNPQQLPIAGGNLATPDGEAQQIMMVSASSAVYFYRPQFSDDTTPVAGQPNTFSGGVTLYASLFSPYWEAHLVPTEPAEKAAVALAQGGL
ncbi:MAG: TadE/TadG family type IV pilus assembly protein [Metallibacterium scheffleri]|jgi:hypothetical protein